MWYINPGKKTRHLCGYSFLLLGWSYGSLDKVGLQILYYITFGGLGIWWFVRLFTLHGDIQNANRRLAASLDFSQREMIELGL